jgi:hypothetical protein
MEFIHLVVVAHITVFWGDRKKKKEKTKEL